jgi:hypothetical protein
MLYFQNSTYLDSPALMTFSFSTDLNTSLPQVGQYGIRLGTLTVALVVHPNYISTI